jgi:hypothetical protein
VTEKKKFMDLDWPARLAVIFIMFVIAAVVGSFAVLVIVQIWREILAP